jgi:hypothetical protein
MNSVIQNKGFNSNLPLFTLKHILDQFAYTFEKLKKLKSGRYLKQIYA